MARLGKRAYLLFGALALAFAAVAALVLHALPAPHKPLHYVAAGASATCAVLVAAFVVLRRIQSEADADSKVIPVRRTAPESAPPS